MHEICYIGTSRKVDHPKFHFVFKLTNFIRAGFLMIRWTNYFVHLINLVLHTLGIQNIEYIVPLDVFSLNFNFAWLCCLTSVISNSVTHPVSLHKLDVDNCLIPHSAKWLTVEVGINLTDFPGALYWRWNLLCYYSTFFPYYLRKEMIKHWSSRICCNQQSPLYEECCGRSSYQGQGQEITCH